MVNDPHKEIARSIRLPQKLWEALEVDAKRCKRSSVRQLEALLTKWYALHSVELQFEPGSSNDSSVESRASRSAPRTRIKKTSKAR